jgi:hypothetical protein
MRTSFALVLCLLAVPAVARADAAVARVGIVVSVTVNVEDATAESIGGQLAAALVKKLKVDAIGGAEVTRRMPDGGLPDECVSTPACIADLGNRLGADQILFLGVVRVGTDFQIDATWVDVASGKQEARPRVQLTDPHKAAPKFEAEAERYLPDAEVRGSNSQTVVVHTEGDRDRPIRPIVWVAAGVSVVALGTGVVLGLQAKSKYDSCNKPEGPFCDDGQLDAIDRRALYSDISLGVGIAAAVGGIVLYFTTPVEVLPVKPSVEPVPGGAVLSLDGRF